MTTSANLDQFETWELEAYAEGVTMPHIQQFVQQHPEMWNAWQQKQQKQEQLYANLKRFDCPSPVQLQQYYWKELHVSETEQIAIHLQQCASCTTELQSLVNYLEVETPTVEAVSLQTRLQTLLSPDQLGKRIQEWGEQVRTIVADFIPPLLPEFAPLALRSGEIIPTLSSTRPATLLFTAEESDVSLVAMKEVDGQIFLSGQVLTDEPIEQGKVSLMPADPNAPELQVALDVAGAFLIHHLPPGYYFMRITLNARAIVIPNVLLQ